MDRGWFMTNTFVPNIWFLRPIAVVALILSGLVMAASAESHVRIVRLSDVDGNVQIDRGTGEGFDAAITNMPVVEGMQIWTRDGSRAEVEFENGSTIRVAAGSHLSFPRLSLDDEGTKISEVQLDGGTGYFDLKPGRHDAFHLRFGQHTVSPRRSVSFRIVMGTSEAELAVMHGDLEVTAANGPVEVGKNHTATFDVDASDTQVEVAKGVEEGPYDDWNRQQRDYHDRYMASASSYTNSPYSYGGSDLSYFGNYIQAGGYGYVWRPYSVGLGWDPFADGAWVFYPGFGYTWVSSAPWGWLPYRYGGWNYIGGYGWCWSPGGWNSWNSMPAIASRPVSYTPPVVPVLPVRGTGGPGLLPGRGVVIVQGGLAQNPGGNQSLNQGLGNGGVRIPVLPVRDDRWQRPVPRGDGFGTSASTSTSTSTSTGPHTVVPTKTQGGFNQSGRNGAPSAPGDRSVTPTNTNRQTIVPAPSAPSAPSAPAKPAPSAPTVTPSKPHASSGGASASPSSGSAMHSTFNSGSTSHSSAPAAHSSSGHH